MDGFPLTKLFVYEYLTGGGIDPDLAGEGSLADLSALIVEGRAMRDALVADLLELDGVQVSFAASRFERVDPARAHFIARPGEPMMRFVGRVAAGHDYAWIIAPECDSLLLQLHDVVGAKRWLGCTRQAISTASSKRETAACLAAQGIVATPALLPHEAVAHEGSRWVVKPDDGAGGLDTFLFDHLDDACAEYNARAAAGRNPVLQEWVDGEPLSLSLICGEHGAELISINRQQIGVAEAAAQRVVAALPGLRGFAGIDLVWHPQRGPVVIEVNPRLTAAYAGLSARLGRNLAGCLLAAHGVVLPHRLAEVEVAAAADTADPEAQAVQVCGASSR